jgi:hypothetical protein
LTATGAQAAGDAARKRIFIVSSYHKTYIWSQSTQKGVNAAMLKFGYLDNEQQAQKLVQTDSVESSKAIIRKEWMDTKRKDSRADMANATTRILAQIQAFKPDLVLLGDDNAAKYIGGQLLDLEFFTSRHFVLLAAGFDDRVHDGTSEVWSLP